MAIACLSKYCGTNFASTADVADETSEGFNTTALPAAIAPAAGTSNSCTG